MFNTLSTVSLGPCLTPAHSTDAQSFQPVDGHFECKHNHVTPCDDKSCTGTPTITIRDHQCDTCKKNKEEKEKAKTAGQS